jgi:formamidopyrimidine-DNA glycosylase
MPELPEVEEVRRSLEPHLLGIPVRATEVLRADFVTPFPPPLDQLVGHAFSRTHRHGKKLFLIADTARAQTLLIHLGLSGRVDWGPAAAPVQKHTHVILHLANGADVRFRDPRRFGGLWYYPTFDAALAAETAALGPDALTLTPDHLAHWRAHRLKGRLKHRLLSQQDVAGLGNIYVDEALFLARLHPLQYVSRIREEAIRTLVDAILQVLTQSIRSGGTTLRDYRNVSNQPGAFARQLQCYGRAEKPCLRCGTPLRSAIIATRTTTFCPICQRCR